MRFEVCRMNGKYSLAVTDPVKGAGFFHPEKRKLFFFAQGENGKGRSYTCWRNSLKRLLRDAENHFHTRIDTYQYTDLDKTENQKTETFQIAKPGKPIVFEDGTEIPYQG
jgi:hypothetical protein